MVARDGIAFGIQKGMSGQIPPAFGQGLRLRNSKSGAPLLRVDTIESPLNLEKFPWLSLLEDATVDPQTTTRAQSLLPLAHRGQCGLVLALSARSASFFDVLKFVTHRTNLRFTPVNCFTVVGLRCSPGRRISKPRCTRRRVGSGPGVVSEALIAEDWFGFERPCDWHRVV